MGTHSVTHREKNKCYTKRTQLHNINFMTKLRYGVRDQKI